MAHLARKIWILPIRFYKLVISPLLPPACRFEPTCSVYAAQAIMRFGILRGSVLMIARLARCHPWGGSGYDPVPERFELSFANILPGKLKAVILAKGRLWSGKIGK